jgi:hypothetical protein
LPTEGKLRIMDVRDRHEHLCAPETTESHPITVLLTLYESPILETKDAKDIIHSLGCRNTLLGSPAQEAVPAISLPITLYCQGYADAQSQD